MTDRLHAWDRFAEPAFWWMHAMVLVWAMFTFILFVAEPLFLHDWIRRRFRRDPDGTFALVQGAHWLLLAAATIAVFAAVLGAHGMLY
jgi:hypothetical protein